MKRAKNDRNIIKFGPFYDEAEEELERIRREYQESVFRIIEQKDLEGF